MIDAMKLIDDNNNFNFLSKFNLEIKRSDLFK